MQGSMRIFMDEVLQTFGSLDHLQSSMSAAAMGMSGSGWVWLVADQNSRLGVIGTYGAGTLLVRSRRQHSPSVKDDRVSRIQSTERPSVTSKTSTLTSDNVMKAPPRLFPRDTSRSFWNIAGDVQERSEARMRGGRTVEQSLGEFLNPLLCISVHEHAWIGSGYGIWGKEEYLRRFWTVVDWEQVASHFGHWRGVHGANLPRPG